MNPALYQLILTKLMADPSMEGQAGELVMAACDGRAGETVEKRTSPAAFLKALAVEGFRGIGPGARLELKPGPGITLVLGRNGSGKSSFAEALEFVLTGSNHRWSSRSKIWIEGWRNLHQPGRGKIEAEFLVESAGATRVWREWGENGGPDGLPGLLQTHGQPRTDLEAFGWSQALADYRPFLSHNELGSVLEDGPSKMYDAISSVLGLGEMVTASEGLRQRRLDCERLVKSVKADLSGLLTKLRASTDPRAASCVQALEGKKWDLGAVEAVLEGQDPAASEGELALLRQLASLSLPEAERVEACASKLEAAAEQVRESAAEAGGRALQTAQLLSLALKFHQQHQDPDCPVCGSPLASDWQARAETEVSRLQEEGSQAKTRLAALKTSLGEARALISTCPAAVARATEFDLDATALTQAWSSWSGGVGLDDGKALAQHLRQAYPVLEQALDGFTNQARERWQRLQDDWRPLVRELAAWMAGARQSEQEREGLANLKKAEKWLKEAEAEIRAQRFAPVAEAARLNWETLRRDSNVELESILLQGAHTDRNRRVALEVTVDGVAGAALGVMSQGELNSLALSLFLPRAMLPDSPFRFIVIDDPVQAMDPAKVEGLARVLEAVGKSHQLIVFTHDSRLSEAMARLAIQADLIEVTRGVRSQVEPRQVKSPADQALADAFALISTPEAGPQVSRRVVPGFCRLAVESALSELHWRRQLAKGRSHREVEAELAEVTSLGSLVALTFYEDAKRVGEARERLGKLDYSFRDLYDDLNRGAHGRFEGDCRGLAQTSQRLVRELARQ